MSLSVTDTLTQLLNQGSAGDGKVIEAVIPLVYDDLRHMARRQLMRQSGTPTLSVTELAHEAYLHLLGSQGVCDKGRGYFFAAAARAMRQIAVDHARARGSQKRGGGASPLTLTTSIAGGDEVATDVLDLEKALARLERKNPRQARVVECIFFGGMTAPETSEALDISLRTVKRDWALARAWLYRELEDAE